MSLIQAHYVGDGRLIGWCTTCGADIFNTTSGRHRCPKKIETRALALILAAKRYVLAKQELQASSLGTPTHRRKQAIEGKAFAELEAAIQTHNEGTSA